MIAFLGIPALAWVLVVSMAFSLAFGLLIGRCIRVGEAPELEVPSDPEQIEPADLDDWLSETEPFFDFELWERPRAEVRVDREAG